MANPIKKLLPTDKKVLPLCYELALGAQLHQQLNLSTSAQTNSESKPPANLEENPYFSKYAEKIKRAQAEKEKEAKSLTTSKAPKSAESQEKEATKGIFCILNLN